MDAATRQKKNKSKIQEAMQKGSGPSSSPSFNITEAMQKQRFTPEVSPAPASTPAIPPPAPLPQQTPSPPPLREVLRGEASTPALEEEEEKQVSQREPGRTFGARIVSEPLPPMPEEASASALQEALDARLGEVSAEERKALEPVLKQYQTSRAAAEELHKQGVSGVETGRLLTLMIQAFAQFMAGYQGLKRGQPTSSLKFENVNWDERLSRIDDERRRQFRLAKEKYGIDTDAIEKQFAAKAESAEKGLTAKQKDARDKYALKVENQKKQEKAQTEQNKENSRAAERAYNRERADRKKIDKLSKGSDKEQKKAAELDRKRREKLASTYAKGLANLQTVAEVEEGFARADKLMNFNTAIGTLNGERDIYYDEKAFAEGTAKIVDKEGNVMPRLTSKEWQEIIPQLAGRSEAEVKSWFIEQGKKRPASWDISTTEGFFGDSKVEGGVNRVNALEFLKAFKQYNLGGEG